MKGSRLKDVLDDKVFNKEFWDRMFGKLKKLATAIEMAKPNMSMDDKETGGVRTVETIGEADPSNCMSKYYGMMAEKRAKDRCILKLIRAYEYCISSDVELADGKNFEKQYFPKTEVQKSDFDRLVHHSCFNGIMKEYQKKFKETNSDSEVNELRQEMIKMTKGKK